MLSIVAGGSIGAIGAFFATRIVTEFWGMICYSGDPEGSCILTAFLAGLYGLPVGAITGLSAAVWRVRRYR
jgi:hypothetical protein